MCGVNVTRDGPNVFKPLEIPQTLNGLVTNDSNQSSPQLIEVLELCHDQLPAEAPAATPGGRGATRDGTATTITPTAIP